jgi:hypothetical protein
MKFRRCNYEVGDFKKTHNTHHHIAYVYNAKGQLIQTSSNRIATRSKGAGYSDRTIHAERAVLKDIGDFTRLKGATMVVIRVRENGDLMPSKPCHECECHLNKAIRVYGLKRIYYS